MKKLATSIIFLAAWYGSLAQTCIEYKQTGILIRANAIDRINNQIRFDITAPIEWIDIAQEQLSITMKCKDGTCIYSNIVSVPNLDAIYHAYAPEQSDVGVPLYLGEQKFAATILLNLGILNLDYNWTIKNK